MAHITKYKQGQCHHLINHDNRSNTDNKENIDHSRSYLNYNLCNVKNENEYLSELIQKSKNNGGRFTDKTNVLISYVITLPENFPNNEALEKEFFKGAYNMIVEDIGEENIISAWVHYDENLKNTNRKGKPHIHIKAAPLKEKIKTYKNGTKKTILQFDAKNIITLNYLQQFHKRLDKNIEEWLGFKTDVNSGITKEQGGNKTISELKAISEQQKKNREIIDKDSDLILAEQKKMLDEKWKQYQNETRGFWNELNPVRQRIKNYIWEYQKGDKTAQKQILRDLDFIGNMFSKGVLFALISLLNGLMLYTRQKIYQKHIDDLKAVYEELESIRRTFSNQQHNTKEDLKSADFERIDDTLNRLEKTSTTAHELIKEVLWRMPESSLEELNFKKDLVINNQYEK